MLCQRSLLLVLLIFSLNGSSIALGNMAGNVVYCGNVSSNLISSSNLTRKLTLKDFVLTLLKMDADARVEILAYELPVDMKAEEHLVKLRDMDSLFYISGAKCFIDKFQDGDVISEYEITNSATHEKGYVLIRGGKFVAVFVLELMIV